MIVLPLPPSANRLWRWTPRGIVKSPEYRAWLNDAAWRVAQQWQQPPLEWFAAYLYVPASRIDLDNRAKPVLDALQAGGAVLDDKRLQWLSLRVNYERKEDEGILIVLEACPAPPAKPKRRKA